MQLSVQVRTQYGKQAKKLRKTGVTPAVVYSKELGQGIHIQFPKNDFIKVFKQTGMSTPIELIGDDMKQLVLVHEIQTHPVNDQLLHVDFLAVRRDKKVMAEVSIILEGVSLIQKNNIGSIQLIKDTIEVEAFPQDLPHDIKIDISKIEHLHDVIFVKDIDLGSKVTIKEDLDQPIVTVTELSSEEAETSEITDAATTPAETESK